MKKIILFAVCLFFMFGPAVVSAADPLVFDSTNNYLGACQMTDTSTWTLDKDINVSTFELWYNWQAGETELPVTVTKDGQPFADFTAKRGSCDPYQASWCNADYEINKVLPKGTYTTKIANARQCLKPGGTGAVRLYGAQASAGTDSGNKDTTPAAAQQSTCANADNSQCFSAKTVYIMAGVIALLALVLVITKFKKGTV